MKIVIEITAEKYEWYKKNIKNPDKDSTVGAVALGVPYEEERPHGEWIPLKNKKGEIVAFRCSSCGQSPKYAVNSDFCPRCGSDNRPKEGKE